METSNEFTRCQRNTMLALSLPAFFLIIAASLAGLLIPGTYYKETINWTSQSMSQDVIDLLLICPVLIISIIFTLRGNRIALTIWGGTNLYLIYTFLIYCFDIHFNRLFLVYCMILGLSFYSFLYFMFLTLNKPVQDFTDNRVIVKVIAIYFIVISCLFYFLWLAKIIPSIIEHTIPTDLAETGLITNPVHVIDIALLLPGLFLTGILLLRKQYIGFFLAPVLLVFCVLMDITIAGLTIGMKESGIETNYSIVVVMGVLALSSIFLFVLYFIRLKSNNHSGKGTIK